ncbi:spermatogenesis-associated protein 48 [Sparus aurata]|uniref:spermatogenesis-associated protein 48 n=1 Tax=Sparus aurata TaxID=8175 RepID=UPI0011C17A6F|nr:spermatogenesis-associated protein 48 [Sparus aurata]
MFNRKSKADYRYEPWVTLAPVRDDIPLLDPCCGQLSAGAEVELGVKGLRERPQTASNYSEDLRQDKAWNSRKIPDAVVRARLNGSADPVKVQPHSPRASTEASSRSRFPDKHTGPQDGFSSDLRLWTDTSTAVQRFRYTSATQRSYEEVSWDTMLPRHLKAPETTLEIMADPVSERPSTRRYNSRPQLWQSVGAEWNRQQLRYRNDAKKPVSFCSGCPRSGQIPRTRERFLFEGSPQMSHTHCHSKVWSHLPQKLYLGLGTIGSENMHNIDNMDEDFHPLTLKRSIIPRYTPTARRTTVPGYTGKAGYVNSAAPAVCSPAHSSGTIEESGGPTFGHVAPLSRTVTTVTPCNPFLRPALPASHTSTRGRH